MLQKLINKLNNVWKQEGQEEMYTPQNVSVRFRLMYKTLPIGYLSLSEGTWSFEYAEEFQKQDEIQTLIDFPNKSERYESAVLWPFFVSRIPGLGQPRVRAMISKHHIDSRNEVELLKLFGKQTLTNPFILQVA